MDPVFSQFVDDAADIKSSGRWAALNGRIKQMATSPGAGNEWYVQLFGQLCYQVLSEYHLLQEAHAAERGRDTQLLAWRARNLLELSVWAEYFAKSRDNARRLYEDAGRDVHELLAAFEKWGQASGQSIDWLNSLANGKTDLVARAAKEGIETLDIRYMRVDNAAAECGLKEHYQTFSKMLSKFVHPTAMQILGLVDDTKHILQRDYFFSLGCLFFAGGFVALEKVASRPL